MSRPNWFFAFPVDGAFLEGLPESPAALRRYHPDDVHMTLAFLGGCGESTALAALGALDVRLREGAFSAFVVSLGPVVPLGRSKGGYTTLSALLELGRAEATRVLTELRDPLHDIGGVAREKRPAKPHVTIGRVRSRASAEQRAEGLAWAQSLDLRNVRATLDRVALYTWAKERGERRFEIVAERRLG
ncbi:MAG TPA: 2'-5' RNA ligase family protein [Polyangiaceae bacterium]